jgi:hypothetical protein
MRATGARFNSAHAPRREASVGRPASSLGGARSSQRGGRRGHTMLRGTPTACLPGMGEAPTDVRPVLALQRAAKTCARPGVRAGATRRVPLVGERNPQATTGPPLQAVPRGRRVVDVPRDARLGFVVEMERPSRHPGWLGAHRQQHARTCGYRPRRLSQFAPVVSVFKRIGRMTVASRAGCSPPRPRVVEAVRGSDLSGRHVREPGRAPCQSHGGCVP